MLKRKLTWTREEKFKTPNNEEPLRPLTDHLASPLAYENLSYEQPQQTAKDAEILEEEVRKQAYLIWLQSKQSDPVANWHTALEQIKKSRRN